MKTLNFTLAVLFLSKLCFAQFHPCSYSPTTNDLYDVYFIDENIGVAVGDSGTILRSTDGGEFWSQVMSNDTINFEKVKFFNSQTGLALGSHLFKTTDAGQSWTQIDIENKFFIDLAILNDTDCIITGAPTGVLKSFDQGETWEILVAENELYYERDYGLLSFVDENIGYTISTVNQYTSFFLKTIDGGYTWDSIFIAPADDWTTNAAFSFTQEGIGFKGGWYSSFLKKTVDDGSNWKTLQTPDLSGIFDFHIEKNQPNAYYACGSHNKIYKSTDQGENWQLMNIDAVQEDFNGIYFLNDSLGWVVGKNGTILNTMSTNNIDKTFDLTISPNPTTGHLTLYNRSAFEIINLTLFDQTGRLIKRLSPSNEIFIEDLPSGIYFLQIEMSDDVVTKKLVKH
jgi:photosystem II stability/assembly factor-like uncharacterized protein